MNHGVKLWVARLQNTKKADAPFERGIGLLLFLGGYGHGVGVEFDRECLQRLIAVDLCFGSRSRGSERPSAVRSRWGPALTLSSIISRLSTCCAVSSTASLDTASAGEAAGLNRNPGAVFDGFHHRDALWGGGRTFNHRGLLQGSARDLACFRQGTGVGHQGQAEAGGESLD